MTHTWMKVKGLRRLARELIAANPGTLRPELIDAFLDHLEASYTIAADAVALITERYPFMQQYLRAEEIALAAGLHDIGRPLDADQLFHELRGAAFVEAQGLALGLAPTREDVHRLAQMMRPHFVVAEQYADEANAAARARLAPLDPTLLIPRTWPEAIVVYAELRNVNGRRVSIETRIADIQKRYPPDSRDGFSASLARAMQAGLPRVSATCARVQRLIDGHLPAPEVARYGFL
jgi:hypothetical protein